MGSGATVHNVVWAIPTDFQLFSYASEIPIYRRVQKVVTVQRLTLKVGAVANLCGGGRAGLCTIVNTVRTAMCRAEILNVVSA
jgi:hypothetical protein